MIKATMNFTRVNQYVCIKATGKEIKAAQSNEDKLVRNPSLLPCIRAYHYNLLKEVRITVAWLCSLLKRI